MFSRLADNTNPRSLAARMRRGRLALFDALLAQVDGEITILDVGGTEHFWRMSKLAQLDRVHITLLNLQAFRTAGANVTSLAGDARDLKFRDASFDVVFSNSVLEHVGGPDDQKRMADEVRRVGRRHFVQTPNRWFPIEPHFVFPFYQFLPGRMQVWLLRNFDLGWIKRTRDEETARRIIAGIRLLSKSEFRALFPGSAIYEEKFLGITKSFVAYGGWGSGRPPQATRKTTS